MAMITQDRQLQDQIRHDVQQSVQDAAAAARDAAQAARAAGGGPPMPGVRIVDTRQFPSVPPQVTDIFNGFFIMCSVIVIGWPLARAFGKRIERRAAEPAAPSPKLTEQLARIEQAVEAMAIEVERISESQRYMARLQTGNAERSN